MRLVISLPRISTGLDRVIHPLSTGLSTNAAQPGSQADTFHLFISSRRKPWKFRIGSHTIGPSHPTYFIADIAANHDGDLERAKLLIRLAKEAGADAAKFQNFRAPHIVSDYGFTHMDGQVSHQAAWKKVGLPGLHRSLHPLRMDPCAETGMRRGGNRFLLCPV